VCTFAYVRARALACVWGGGWRLLDASLQFIQLGVPKGSGGPQVARGVQSQSKHAQDSPITVMQEKMRQILLDIIHCLYIFVLHNAWRSDPPSPLQRASCDYNEKFAPVVHLLVQKHPRFDTDRFHDTLKNKYDISVCILASNHKHRMNSRNVSRTFIEQRNLSR
jgi:hypothetical protein